MTVWDILGILVIFVIWAGVQTALKPHTFNAACAQCKDPG